MESESTETPFPKIDVQRLSGQETFQVAKLPLEANVQGFWQWSCSDLLGNTLRGQLAEYMVGLVLGCVHGARQEWDAFDLEWTPSGANAPIRIEIKSASYLQSWSQKELSTISFDIAPKKSWDAKTNTIQEEPTRAAHVYVFCLLHHQDKVTVNPLELTQWSFFVVPTHGFKAEWQHQKRISLGPLERLHGPACAFIELPDRILAAASSLPS
ncbi:MAG: hypothetical protein ACK5OB_09855 [Pirellula sp.]